MIPSVCASVLLILVLVCARWRGRRRAAEVAAAVKERDDAWVEWDAADRLVDAEMRRSDRLATQLGETQERLVCATRDADMLRADRDALQLVAAGCLRRAWRAERALAAVQAAAPVAEAERIVREAAQ